VQWEGGPLVALGEKDMATVTTVDGYRVFAGTLAECAAFVAAWAMVSTTPVRVIAVARLVATEGEVF